mgnify:CR=1 FL=1
MRKKDNMKSANMDKHELLQYVRKKMSGKKIAVWGTGKLSIWGEAFLQSVKISDYCYIDSSREKQGRLFRHREILPPEVVSKEYYLLIATSAFPEIALDLYKKGFCELEDYIYVCDLTYYQNLLKYRDEPRVPEVTKEMLKVIGQNLKECVLCEDFIWQGEDKFESYKKACKEKVKQKFVNFENFIQVELKAPK